MWPSTSWSLSSLTLNIVFGSASTISPSISIFSSFATSSRLDEAHVHRLRPLRPGLLLVLDLRVLTEGPEAPSVDARVVDEQVAVALVGGDEPVSLLVVEPLDGPGRHGGHAPSCRMPARNNRTTALALSLRGRGETTKSRGQRPSKLALPGPSARNVSTARWRSAVPGSGAPISGARASAPRTPSSRKARTIRFVAALATVGPFASRRPKRSDCSASSPSGSTRFTTLQRSSVAAS